MKRVLITRPLAANARLAGELEASGYQVATESLLTIMPTNTPRPPERRLQAVIITSANALRMLESHRDAVADLLNHPCFCVGPHTAQAARSFGFQLVTAATGDGGDLAHAIHNRLTDHKTGLLHISGANVASKAQRMLVNAGYHIVNWPVYQALAATAFSPSLQQQFKHAELNAVLLFSPRTALQFLTLTRQHKLEACCASLTAIGLSEAVTAVLRPLPWRQLVAAGRPSEAAVLACLRSFCPAS